jgi:hypothetical protein
MGLACGETGIRRKTCILMEKLVGKRPPGKPQRRWEENIKIHLREISGKLGVDGDGPGSWQWRSFVLR